MRHDGLRYWTLCAASAAALFVLALAVGVGVPAERISAQAGSVGSGDLRVDSRTDVSIRGVFGYGGSLVAYRGDHDTSSRVVDAGLVVNGKALQVRKDLATGAITIDGHGNALSATDAEALFAMVQEVGPTDIGVPDKPPQEVLLYRLLEYVASAPTGTVLGRSAVPKDTVSEAAESRQQSVELQSASLEQGPAAVESVPLGLSAPAGLSGPSVSPEECAGGKAIAPWNATTVSLACQRRDEDGRDYLTCQTKTRGASYDGRRNCFKKFPAYSGPKTGKCVGRCGPTCGKRKKGAYMQDCLDHDVCCGRYGGCINGVFGSCSDEFREADDDFFRAVRQCYDG